MGDNKDQAPSSCIDLRVQGDRDQSTDDDERTRSLIKSLLKEILETPNKDEMYQEISQGAKNIVTDQGKLEALEILMIKETVRCKSCHEYATLGHIYCKCGLVLPQASDEVKKQVLENVIICFSMLTTSAFILQTRKAQKENNWSQGRLPIVVQSA